MCVHIFHVYDFSKNHELRGLIIVLIYYSNSPLVAWVNTVEARENELLQTLRCCAL